MLPPQSFQVVIENRRLRRTTCGRQRCGSSRNTCAAGFVENTHPCAACVPQPGGDKKLMRLHLSGNIEVERIIFGYCADDVCTERKSCLRDVTASCSWDCRSPRKNGICIRATSCISLGVNHEHIVCHAVYPVPPACDPHSSVCI